VVEIGVGEVDGVGAVEMVAGEVENNASEVEDERVRWRGCEVGEMGGKVGDSAGLGDSVGEVGDSAGWGIGIGAGDSVGKVDLLLKCGRCIKSDTARISMDGWLKPWGKHVWVWCWHGFGNLTPGTCTRGTHAAKPCGFTHTVLHPTLEDLQYIQVF